MIFFKKWFRKETKIDKATVRLEKLSKWVDLQFKSDLEPILLQLQTNYKSIKTYKKELDEKIHLLQQQEFSEPKDHIKKLVLDYRQRFIQSIQDFFSNIQTETQSSTFSELEEIYTILSEKMDDILQRKKQVEHVLFKYFKTSYSQITHILDKIKQNITQYNQIIDDKKVEQYHALKKQLQTYFQKQNEEKKLEEKKSIVLQQIDEQQIILHKYKTKITHILQDPKYKIEQERKKKGESAFQPAYYELELKDLYARKETQDKKISVIESQMRNINAQIAQLRLDEELTLIKKHIYRYLQIEVEILV